MSNAKFRAGMVGAGNICEFHVAAVKKQAPEIELVGVTDLDAARLLIWRAAFLLDAKSPEATQAAAMGKRFATDVGFQVVNDALQLHGGYGYLKDFPIERYLRDLRVHQILEGTNEIMRVIISRRLLMG